MRFKTSLFIFCGISLISCVSEANPVRKIVPKGAVSFTSKSQGFAVWFPVKPVESKKDYPKVVNNRAFTVSIFEARTQSVNYSVSVWPKQPLDGFFISVPPDPAIKSRKREQIQLNGFSGNDIESIYSSGEMIRAHIYFTPKNTYRVAATGQEADMQKQSAQINRVFDSFRLSTHSVLPVKVPSSYSPRGRPS